MVIGILASALLTDLVFGLPSLLPQVLFEIIIFLDLPTLSTFSTLQGEPLKVLVTGAAGQIAYSLLYSVAKGDVFGKDQVGFLSSF